MTILCIEDNRLFRELIQYSLDDMEVHVVGTLAEAKEWLKENRVDLLLVDLGLPDSNGIDTLKALSATKVPKVILTAHPTYAQECAKLGAIDYILKGDDSADVLERIKFNISRVNKCKSKRFAPHVFEQLKTYICPPPRHELTLAH